LRIVGDLTESRHIYQPHIHLIILHDVAFDTYIVADQATILWASDFRGVGM
jgi:hypothetical protein